LTELRDLIIHNVQRMDTSIVILYDYGNQLSVSVHPKSKRLFNSLIIRRFSLGIALVLNSHT
ncbi:MAG: hypothetical protein ACXWCG_12255, partial [Flavitalea sp.]